MTRNAAPAGRQLPTLRKSRDGCEREGGFKAGEFPKQESSAGAGGEVGQAGERPGAGPRGRGCPVRAREVGLLYLRVVASEKTPATEKQRGQGQRERGAVAGAVFEGGVQDEIQLFPREAVGNRQQPFDRITGWPAIFSGDE